MSFDLEISEMQDAIDLELHSCVDSILKDYPSEFISMFNFQMGWEGEKAGKDAQGKRIRPLLVLLACQACGGDWRKSLPAAAAVELVHNFSLIHDDIQDGSDTRRGRPTVWIKWGNAQAINTGDAMLTVAQLSILKLSDFFEPEIVNRAVQILQSTCLCLTRGQHLDIAFEDKDYLPLELYWQMVEGKTGALIAACLGLGALAGGADSNSVKNMMAFGYKIGSAFQVQDDWLGIWGDDEKTGKSSTSDLCCKKKTYPILLGIQKKENFHSEWRKFKNVTPDDARRLAELLEQEGCREATKMKFEALYSEGFEILDSLSLDPVRTAPLRQIVGSLFGRIK